MVYLNALASMACAPADSVAFLPDSRDIRLREFLLLESSIVQEQTSPISDLGAKPIRDRRCLGGTSLLHNHLPIRPLHDRTECRRREQREPGPLAFQQPIPSGPSAPRERSALRPKRDCPG